MLGTELINMNIVTEELECTKGDAKAIQGILHSWF